MDQHSEKTDQRPATRSEQESTPLRPTSSNDWQALLQLTVIATVGSAFIALYVLWIGMSGHHKRNVDTAAQAALYAAEQLSLIHVDSTSFGKVGLCDAAADVSGTFSYAPGQARVTGLNTIYKTLAVDTAIAKHLKRKVMLDLIEKDQAQAKMVEKELSMRLHEAAEPDLMEAQSSDSSSQLYANSNTKPNNIYRDVYRMLASDKSTPDLSLIEVRLKLGRYRLPAAPSETWPTGKIRLMDQTEQFESAKNGQAPYAVLVEAIFQTKPKNNSDQIQTVSKKHCALIAAPPQPPVKSTLVMNFPDGTPPVLDCAMALLTTPGLSGNGDWQQVVGNEVPGRGSLSPSLQPVLPGMSASDAFSVMLYHWLKRQGPTVNEQQLYALLNAKWNSSASLMKYQREPVNGDEGNATPNSCLAIDTGARQYAILNQTGPGGIGQTALSKAFEIYSGAIASSSQTNFPQNALPLFVDQDGNCNLSGRHDYNDKFVNDYLKAVYDTNIAAIESAAVSRMVIARTSAELTQLEQKIYIEKQELNSVINRLNRSGQEHPPGKNGTTPNEVARQNTLIKEKIDTLNSVIASDEEKRSALRATNKLAQQTTRTANQVATSTYELCAHSFKVCKDGIYKIDKPYSAYLISKKFIFTPHTQPVDESDFFKPYAEVSTNSKPWLVKGFDVVTPIENGPVKPEALVVEGKTFAEFAAANSLQRANTKVVFLTTDELFSSNTPRPMVFNFYPFGNIKIPSGQLFYYCKDAMKTGAAPSVSWSVVIRDLVASVGQNSQGFPTGDPIASNQPDWCKISDQHECPGLACEFQLRTPLPVITNSPETSLTNPVNNAQIQQMPPVPADML
ncbi:MAG: hypothetical protein EKK48_22055 [Candidatus Melainabacteria bacterium]|nr:MAG: hypothetical protein EKK48_22055 [Candidatus Melainabacteria bacterium]